MGRTADRSHDTVASLSTAADSDRILSHDGARQLWIELTCRLPSLRANRRSRRDQHEQEEQAERALEGARDLEGGPRALTGEALDRAINEALKESHEAFKRKDFARAEEISLAALKRLGREPRLISNLALSIENQNRPEDALRVADTGLESFPENPHLWNLRGAILKFLGELDGAREAFARAIQHDPRSHAAWRNHAGAEDLRVRGRPRHRRHGGAAGVPSRAGTTGACCSISPSTAPSTRQVRPNAPSRSSSAPTAPREASCASTSRAPWPRWTPRSRPSTPIGSPGAPWRAPPTLRRSSWSGCRGVVPRSWSRSSRPTARSAASERCPSCRSRSARGRSPPGCGTRIRPRSRPSTTRTSARSASATSRRLGERTGGVGRPTDKYLTNYIYGVLARACPARASSTCAAIRATTRGPASRRGSPRRSPSSTRGTTSPR